MKTIVPILMSSTGSPVGSFVAGTFFRVPQHYSHDMDLAGCVGLVIGKDPSIPNYCLNAHIVWKNQVPILWMPDPTTKVEIIPLSQIAWAECESGDDAATAG